MILNIIFFILLKNIRMRAYAFLLLLVFAAFVTADPQKFKTKKPSASLTPSISPSPQPTTVDYYDSTCREQPATRSRMYEVNHAKSLGVGNHSCVETTIVFNPDGTVLTSFSKQSLTDSFYYPPLGSLRSITSYPNGDGNTLIIDEYPNENVDSVCVTIDNPMFSNMYIESKDQNKGETGSTWRAIGYYDKTSNKELKAMQMFHPTSYGDLLPVIFLDDNHHYQIAVFSTCTLIN